MATNVARSKRNLKRTESRKSHSWWWESHISPKNSRWLENNLEEMDRSVKRMLKLIEEDADSFAKKAEMYYQKRPELISLVEQFYRMYRSLAERYDYVTGELRKSCPSDLQSSSGISDVSSELPSSMWQPSAEQRLTHRSSGHRAAGFEFFLGSGGSGSDVYQKGDESSSLTDSGPESDDSSVNNYSGSMTHGSYHHALNKRIMDPEVELGEGNEKLKMQQEGDTESSLRRVKSEKNFSDLQAKIAVYEHELKDANRKIQVSEAEINMLKIELSRCKPSEIANGFQAEWTSSQEGTCGFEGETPQDPDRKIQVLSEELRLTRQRLQDAEKEIFSLKQELEGSKSADQKLKSLQNQFELVQKEATTWKNKVNTDKREVLKLQERISMLKSSLVGRDHEIRDLKLAVSDAEQKIFPEKAQIKAELSKLLEERSHQEEQLKELESHIRSLEDDIRRMKNDKAEMEERQNREIEHLKAETAERGSRIENLNESLNALKSERDGLNTEMESLRAEVSSRDDMIDQTDRRLQELEMRHAEVVAGAEELRSRVKELKEEVERERRVIAECAEEKREVIRQLCFSMDHYRDGYIRLRRAFAGNRIKGVPVLAA